MVLKIQRFIILITCCMMMATSAVVVAQTDRQTEYKINIDDVLEIAVYGEDDKTKTVKVANDGMISYTFIGNVKVAGLTAKEAEQQIAELLEKEYFVNPQVGILIKQYGKVVVLGQVNKPGAYELKAGLTVVEAIALAGGMTELAAPNGTKVIRKHGEEKITISVPVDSILKGGDSSKDIILEPNDTVVVPESFL
jgi:protein involved in polysaccharide export with SLBB domain